MRRIAPFLVASLLAAGARPPPAGAADDPPRILATSPVDGSEGPASAFRALRVLFDRDMEAGAFSIVPSDRGATPPVGEGGGFRNPRTFELPLGRLEPGATYAIGLNSAKRQGFRSRDGTPLAPASVLFRVETAGAAGAPFVESSSPDFGALDVPPDTPRILLRFSEAMRPRGMSLLRIDGTEKLGYVEGSPPRFTDARTLEIPVALRPDTLYGVGANRPGKEGFAAEDDGKGAVPFQLVFRTGGAPKRGGSIAGRWSACDAGGALRVHLREDGRYDYEEGGERASGRWSTRGSDLVLEEEGKEPLVVPFSLEADGSLVVTVEGTRVRLAREGAAPPAPPASPASPAPPPPPSPPSPPSTGVGEILYTRVEMVKAANVSEPLPRRQLWCMSPDGTQRRPIFGPDALGEGMEAWFLPDGSGYVFSAVFDQGRSACLQDVFFCRRDGTGRRRLTGAEAPAEIPDRGAGSIRCIWYDDTQRHPGEDTTVEILWWSGRGLYEDKGERFGQKFFELHGVPAGKVWVRLFVNRHVGSLQIVDVVPGGTTEARFRLTEGNWLAGRGSMTPDGRHLVYLSQLAYWDPSRQHRRPKDPLHPDDVVVPRAPEGVGFDTIAVLDLGRGAVPVASWDPTRMGGAFAKDPRLSADGRLIAFAKGVEPMQTLAVMTLESLLRGKPEVRDLVAPEAVAPGVAVGNASPAFRPDGRRIAFLRYTMSTGGIQGDLWSVDADGGDRRRITRVGQNELAFWPSWSPDGTRIAYAVATGRGPLLTFEDLGRGNVSCDVWVVGADGEGARKITDDGRSSEPSWAP